MHIAIDDTYGPTKVGSTSKYVTGARRTHVGVLFSDTEVEDIRSQLTSCLNEIKDIMSIEAEEFHFAHIYNKKRPWNFLEGDQNLSIFEFFADIYSKYRWPVMIQTIDERTLMDHGIQKIVGKLGKINLEEDSHLSLFFLMLKIKKQLKEHSEKLTILIDEGIGNTGQNFGVNVFYDWSESPNVRFEASKTEPLLQIADFIAYSINRCTHLMMKPEKSETDLWFLELIGNMGLNSEDVIVAQMSSNFQTKDFDEIHRLYMCDKGLN
jgi:hypothetical protein